MNSNSKLNINPIRKLTTFINEYPDQSLHEQFKILSEAFPTHRAIKGDGNCFYRAFAFLYLSTNPCSDYAHTFPKTILSYKKYNSAINQNQQFQSKLYEVWERYIKGLSQVKSQAEKQRKLQMLFNDISSFDELMIGYFRSINYQYMLINKSKLLPFAKNQIDFQSQLQRVSQFGAESEGIQIYSLADAMKIKITIFYIDQNVFQPIEYMEQLQNKGFYLFFRPGHYDIVYPNNMQTHDGTSKLKKVEETLHNFKFISNNKINFNEFENKKSNNKNKQQIHQQKNDRNNYQTQNKQQNNTFSNRYSEKAPQKKMQRKTTNFQSSIGHSDGKFDLMNKKGDYQKTKVYESAPRTSTLTNSKSTSNPVIISSYDQTFERLRTQVFTVVALIGIGWLAYHYFM